MSTLPASHTYLNAPFGDKDRVKALGARWDAAQRRWYVPPGLDLAPFAVWLPGQGRSAAIPTAPAPMPVQLEAAAKGVSLSQLLRGVGAAVAQAYRAGVWTRVEVTGAQGRNGHVYLELAERNGAGQVLAQARAMIWAGTAAEIVPAFERATGVVLAGGIKLLVRAKPTVHEVYGLSHVIDAIDPQYTLGDLEARRREIRARLQREGVFDANRRLPAPWDFHAVLVVAPEAAAGLGDFQAEARRLEAAGLCRFVYAHSRFQGEGSALLISQALQRALAAWAPGQPDAVVIIRGGGAVNDLAWLDDYTLARCLCALRVPVLTGIGHERDNTVLDEVAHRRFDTPSKVIAGIEQLIAQRARETRAHFELVARLATRLAQQARRDAGDCHDTVRSGAKEQLLLARQRTAQALADVRLDAQTALGTAATRTRELVVEVRHEGTGQLAVARESARALMTGVLGQARQVAHGTRLQVRADLQTVLERSVSGARLARDATWRNMDLVAEGARRTVAEAHTRAQALVREIAGQGPATTLQRGFAIVRSGPQPRILTAAAEVLPGQSIDIEFRDGHVAARIISTDPTHDDKDLP